MGRCLELLSLIRQYAAQVKVSTGACVSQHTFQDMQDAVEELIDAIGEDRNRQVGQRPLSSMGVLVVMSWQRVARGAKIHAAGADGLLVLGLCWDHLAWSWSPLALQLVTRRLYGPILHRYLCSSLTKGWLFSARSPDRFSSSSLLMQTGNGTRVVLKASPGHVSPCYAVCLGLDRHAICESATGTAVQMKEKIMERDFLSPCDWSVILKLRPISHWQHQLVLPLHSLAGARNYGTEVCQLVPTDDGGLPQ